MCDVITAQERELIDAAVKRGKKVTKVPTGVSSQPTMYWDEGTNRLRIPEGKAINKNTIRAGKIARARRKLLRGMDIEGKIAKEIGLELGVSASVIRRDLRIIAQEDQFK